MMKEVKIVANRIITPDGTLLWSRYTHDYVEYKDDNSETYMTDGGPNEYCRRSVNKVPYTEASVYNTDPWEVQREVILRGTFDRDGNRVWVPLSKLSDGHIMSLVSECVNNTNYYKELKYRNENMIEVPEHDYAKDAIQPITKNYKS